MAGVRTPWALTLENRGREEVRDQPWPASFFLWGDSRGQSWPSIDLFWLIDGPSDAPSGPSKAPNLDFWHLNFFLGLFDFWSVRNP